MGIKLRMHWLLVPVLLASLLAGCQPGDGGGTGAETKPAPTLASKDVSLVILHTGDVIGYIDKCG